MRFPLPLPKHLPLYLPFVHLYFPFVGCLGSNTSKGIKHVYHHCDVKTQTMYHSEYIDRFTGKEVQIR